MPNYGCPYCGCGTAEMQTHLLRNTDIRFGFMGAFVEGDSEVIQDLDYPETVHCTSCGNELQEAVELCHYCDLPLDSCECEFCDDCEERLDDCVCNCCEGCGEYDCTCKKKVHQTRTGLAGYIDMLTQ